MNILFRVSAAAIFLLVSPPNIVLAQPVNPDIPPPTFSVPGGFFSSSFELTLLAEEPDDIILYTTDGSEPLPALLDGGQFSYKNSYPEAPGQPFGALLFENFTTLQYDAPIDIQDRSEDPDRLSQKSTTSAFEPTYLPESPSFKGTVVRTRVWRPGVGLSEIATESYFISPEGSNTYNIPVISIALNESEIFDYEDGIAVPGITFDTWRTQNPSATNAPRSANNFWRRGRMWESESSFSMWIPGTDEPVLSGRLGFRIHGFSSRSFPKKSWRLYARGEYGASTFDYPIFESQTDESFKRLILFSGSGDLNKAQLRDPVLQRILQPTGVETVDSRPAVLFLNGEYYGVYHIRERYDHHYFLRKKGIEEENLEILSNNQLEYGDPWNESFLNNFVNQRDIADPDVYDAFTTIVDTSSFWTVFAANMYMSNRDWLPNNTEMWRSKQADAQNDTKWRFASVDLDLGWGWSGENDLMRDMIDEVLVSNTEGGQPGFSYHGFVAEMFRNAMENERFRHGFINRSADLMNTVFVPEYANAVIENYAEEMAPYMPEQIERWEMPSNMGNWLDELNFMGQFSEERPEIHRQHIISGLEASGTYDLTLDVNNPEGGTVRVNSVMIDENTPGITGGAAYPWTGKYFNGVPITVTAIPEEGYSFAGWEGDLNGISAEKSFDTEDASAFILATFVENDTVPDTPREVFSYWHFNSLPTSGEVDNLSADESLTGGGVITYPGEGDGYMDDVNDGSEINLQLDYPAGRALRVRNPSAERSLIISASTEGYANIQLTYAAKRTNNGAQRQEIAVKFSPNDPWVLIDSADVFTDFVPYLFDFSGYPEANDNSDFQIRIRFTDAAAFNTSGNNRFDNVSLTGVSLEDGGIPLLPLAQSDFIFEEWPADAPEGSYPDYLVFFTSEDPTSEDFDVKAAAGKKYPCKYDRVSLPRFNGLGENGFSVISDSVPQFDNCTGIENGTGFYTGSAVIGLNTEDVLQAEMKWTAAVAAAGDRPFALRLQYRTGGTGRFFDVPEAPEFTTAGKSTGDSEQFEISLPEFLLNRSEVHLRFVYFADGSSSGSFSAIALDAVEITTDAVAPPLLTTSSATLEGFFSEPGTPGDVMTYTVEGTNLIPSAGNISVFAPFPFEISADGENFSSEIQLAYEDSALNQEVSVRLRASAPRGEKRNLQLIHTGGGAPPVTVLLSGEAAFPINLSAGDIAVIGYRGSANDGFVFTNRAPVPAGTVLIFTDRAFDGTALASNENVIVWRNNAGYTLPPGVVVKIGGPELGDGEGTNIGKIEYGRIDGLSQSGDNIFAIQGSLSQPAWIYGLSYLSGWLTSGEPSNSTSYLPGLLNFPERNNTVFAANAEYDATRSDAEDFNTYFALIHDTENWRTDDEGEAFGDFNTTFFTIPGACELSGGTLSTETGGSFCVGTGQPQFAEITVSGEEGPNKLWVLFDAQGTVLAIRTEDSNFNLDFLPPGNFGIGYVVYENNVPIFDLSNINELATLPGCVETAAGTVSLYLRTLPNAGEPVLDPSGPFCVGNTVVAEVEGDSGEQGLFFVTEAGSSSITATSEAGSFSAAAFEFGSHDLYHVSFGPGAFIEGAPSANGFSGCYAVSDPITFKVVNCIIDNLDIYPNPSGGSSTISFSVIGPTRASLGLFDMQGRLLKSIYNGDAAAQSDYTFMPDVSHLPNGIYIVRLVTEGEVQVRKLTVAR